MPCYPKSVMLLFKCILAGLLAIVIVAILLVVVMVSVLPRPDQGTAVGIDPVSIMRSRPISALMVISLSFACGFLWEYGRAR